jgi:guanyl-specific ribonuclease Sa
VQDVSEYVIYQGTGEWSALYVDGKLERVGDHYLIDERLQELVGVSVVSSDDFMRGQDEAAFVAPTVADVETYKAAREREQQRADALRQQALDLQAEAAEIERKIGR